VGIPKWPSKTHPVGSKHRQQEGFPLLCSKCPQKPNRKGKPSPLVQTSLNRYGWQEGFPLLNSPMKHNGKGFPSCWFKPAPTWTTRRRDPFSFVWNHTTKHNTKGFSSQLVQNGPKCGWQGGVCPPCTCNSQIRGQKERKKQWVHLVHPHSSAWVMSMGHSQVNFEWPTPIPAPYPTLSHRWRNAHRCYVPYHHVTPEPITHLPVRLSRPDTTGTHPAARGMSGPFRKDLDNSRYFRTSSRAVGYLLYLGTSSDDTMCLSFLPICSLWYSTLCSSLPSLRTCSIWNTVLVYIPTCAYL